MIHPESGERAGMPLRAYWCTQQNHISSIHRPQTIPFGRGMRALGLSSGSIKDTKNLSMAPHWDRVGRSWSVEVTMVQAWYSVRFRDVGTVVLNVPMKSMAV